VCVNRRGLTTRTYWKLEATDHRDDLPTTVQKTRELIEQAVRQQLVSDVPICSLASGGLDSSVITALAKRARTGNAESIRSFSVSFAPVENPAHADPLRPSDDTPYVQEFAKYAQIDHKDIALDAGDLAGEETWDATMRARDLPPLGDMDSSLFLMCKAIRQHATVALSGEGADELFGGYRWFHDPDAVGADTFPWLAAAGRLGREAVFEPRLRHLDLGAYQATRYRQALAEMPVVPGEDAKEKRMSQISYLHLTRFLPIPLDRKDRLSMAVGLEIRVPYCDHRLVEYVFNVPWHMKSFDGREKSLLRAAASDLVPPSILNRPKNPFPAIQDPGYHARLRDAVSNLLNVKSAPVMAILNRPTVRALAAMPPTGAQLVRLGLERILRLNDWLERYHVNVYV
jgi:asparagine synthase (glutamine-hydrolysing)